MQFNEKLRELRLKKGLSQAELAEKIFVSRSAVAKWENGLGLPSEESFNLLADFFGIKREELYSDKATECVIVSKNVAISKSRKILIVVGIACLLIIIAFVTTLSVLLSERNKYDEIPIGGDVPKIVGVQGTIFELDENGNMTVAQTANDGDYLLTIGKKYVLFVQPRQTGGSVVAMFSPESISFIYDKDIFDIQPITEDKDGTSIKSTWYYLTVKEKSSHLSVTVCSHNFFENLVIIA